MFRVQCLTKFLKYYTYSNLTTLLLFNLDLTASTMPNKYTYVFFLNYVLHLWGYVIYYVTVEPTFMKIKNFYANRLSSIPCRAEKTLKNKVAAFSGLVVMQRNFCWLNYQLLQSTISFTWAGSNWSNSLHDTSYITKKMQS